MGGLRGFKRLSQASASCLWTEVCALRRCSSAMAVPWRWWTLVHLEAQAFNELFLLCIARVMTFHHSHRRVTDIPGLKWENQWTAMKRHYWMNLIYHLSACSVVIFLGGGVRTHRQVKDRKKSTKSFAQSKSRISNWCGGEMIQVPGNRKWYKANRRITGGV